MLLAAAVIAGTLSGCGNSAQPNETVSQKQTTKNEATQGSGSEGKVINIYSWNNEFRQRVEAVYPEVKETSAD